MIEFKNVCKSYSLNKQSFEVLKNVNLHIPENSIFGVVGESGAGKTTLLRSINVLEKISSGEIWVDGIDIQSLNAQDLLKFRKNISCVFQGYHLFSSYTVFDNVAYPLHLAKKSKHTIQNKVSELLGFVNLSEKSLAYPEQLSGGQKQRVAIARALAGDAKILLLDEPTSALDQSTTQNIVELIQKIHKQFNLTIVIISHEIEFLKKICTHMAYLKDGQLVESGEAESFLKTPKSEQTQSFLNPNLRLVV